MRSVDVHQHLWPDEALRVLERRAEAPRATWERGRWRLDLRGEPSFEIDPADHDPELRARELNVDHALVALSSPVGAEGLPARDALAVVAAWEEAVKSLPPALGWWSAVPGALPADDGAVIAREAIAAGAAGVCVPATRLATPTAVEQVLPLLEVVASAQGALFVHPGETAGPGAPGEAAAGPGTGGPAWWAPATGYVAQQHAAWHAFHLVGRPQVPELRVIFALLAGLAPLHLERTSQRSNGALAGAPADPLCFYDTSSYGPRALTAMAAAVGIGQLVHGSDYPVVRPHSDPVAEAFGTAAAESVRRDGPARALGYA